MWSTRNKIMKKIFVIILIIVVCMLLFFVFSETNYDYGPLDVELVEKGIPISAECTEDKLISSIDTLEKAIKEGSLGGKQRNLLNCQLAKLNLGYLKTTETSLTTEDIFIYTLYSAFLEKHYFFSFTYDKNDFLISSNFK